MQFIHLDIAIIDAKNDKGIVGPTREFVVFLLRKILCH
jgi:hypothetical protein